LLFSDHNFHATNARTSKVSEDADFRLVFKKHEAPFCGWGSGPNECGPAKSLKILLLWRHPQNNSNPKLATFLIADFRIRGFEQLSSSIGRQVMTGWSHWNYSGFVVQWGNCNDCFKALVSKQRAERGSTSAVW